MKTGELVTDSQGTTWTVGQELGRGTWGRSFVARSHAGREAVLKVALEPAELFGDEADLLARACNGIVVEQAAWMRERRRPWLPELIDTFQVPSGAQALLIPRYPMSLGTRMKAGASLDSLLQALLAVADHVASGIHGNLRPSNLLIADDGQVRLTDPLTPTFEAHAARLLARAGDRRPLRPPEATGTANATWDTWAVCALLWWVASQGTPGPDGRREEPAPLPAAGLDKVALSTLKDKVNTRLLSERANPRFATRLADKLATLMNRGLSAQAAPSPPYRFTSPAELRGRLAEVHDLIDPRVQTAGKVLLSSAARDGLFEGGAVPAFSTTVSCTPGVLVDDLIAGLLVRDLDAEGDDRVPVPDARFSVASQPSGRLRFDFELPELRPGRYTVRVAFSVKESGHEPTTVDGHFEIRPPPGYVPPPEEVDAPSALVFRPPRPDPTPAQPAGRGNAPGFDDEMPGFPSPIAPSDPGSYPGVYPSPSADPHLADGSEAPPPVLRAASGPRTAPDARNTADPRGEPPREARTDGRGAPRPADPPSRPSAASNAGPARVTPPVDAPRGPSPALRPPEISVPTPRGSARPPGFDDPPPQEVPRISAVPSIAPPAPDAPEPEVTAEVRGGRAAWSPKKDRQSVDPAWGGSATWDAVPSVSDLRDGPDGLLPGSEGMDDLPAFEQDHPRAEGAAALVEQALAIIRENAWLALGVVIALLVLVLIVAGVLFQALAG